MKYLLPCPACGRKSPVATGQAGQTIQCSCGEKFEIPSIRKLRDLELAEEEPLTPLWTKRQGLLFIGLLITLCSAAFAGAIWIYRPAPFIPPPIKFDQSAVEQEVEALSSAEAFRRFAMIQPQLRSTSLFEQRVQSKAAPPYLLVSGQPLMEFEGRGPMPMAPKQMEGVMAEVMKYSAQIRADASVRQSLNYWLWVAGGGAAAGILIACSALLVRSGKSRRPQRTRQVA